MRDIKFRAWENLEKQMLYFDFEDLLRGEVPLHPASCDFYLMAFTGLLDKNGKEVYEGDIVRTKHGLTRKIFMRLGCWYVDGCEELGYCNDQVEIIGNIYENPELLQ